MKFCPECGTDKPLDRFSKNASRYDGLQSHCKDCRSARRKVDYTKNKERELLLSRVWARENPDAVKDKAKRHRQSEHGYAYYNAKNAKRRAAKLSATPMWLTPEQEADIKSMYALAKKFEALCGVEYHVDHIVPLAGETVCGLHVPWNLQLLPASLNMSKGNRYNGPETFREPS